MFVSLIFLWKIVLCGHIAGGIEINVRKVLLTLFVGDSFRFIEILWQNREGVEKDSGEM